MVVILAHGAAGDGELVNAAGADGRGCLAAEDDALRQLVVIGLVLERTVVEPGDIKCGSHVVAHYGIRRVHAHRDRPCGILAVADGRQPVRHLRSLCLVVLVGHFVAYAPHHDGGCVAEVADEVYQVAFRPLVEVLVVTVGYLGRAPFVERLGHDHDAHFVAQADEFGRRHIVRCADGVRAHFFQLQEAASQRAFVHGHAQRAQVLVVADAFELNDAPVEQEALSGGYFDGAEAERVGHAVAETAAVVEARHGAVQVRRFQIPPLRSNQVEELNGNAVRRA